MDRRQTKESVNLFQQKKNDSVPKDHFLANRNQPPRSSQIFTICYTSSFPSLLLLNKEGEVHRKACFKHSLGQYSFRSSLCPFFPCPFIQIPSLCRPEISCLESILSVLRHSSRKAISFALLCTLIEGRSRVETVDRA